MGTVISRASLLDFPVVLGIRNQLLSLQICPRGLLVVFVPSARSGVAGRARCRLQAAGPSVPAPFWETFRSPYCTQEPGVRDNRTAV